MSKTPIHALIDAAAKCAKCGAPMGKCSCWVTLRCPTCKRTMTVERQDYDPPNATVVQVGCDKCDRGDFENLTYYDADGRQINCDGDSITPAC